MTQQRKSGGKSKARALGDGQGARCDPRFSPLLNQFRSVDLDRNPDTVYGLWPDLTLSYLNRAWFNFAAANGGEPAISDRWGLGTPVADAWPECLRTWYRDFMAAAFATGGKRPAQHEYECSSSELRRRFVMSVYSLAGPSGDGLLVVNSPLIEAPWTALGTKAMPPVSPSYVDAAGLMHQCVHCRRIRTIGNPAEWHWVPEWVAHAQPNVSHVLCDLCLEHYYPTRGRA